MKRYVIAGGGVTGLAAAYELRRREPDATVVVHEASDRLGGKIVTSPFAEHLVDEGADAFLARVPWALDLCRELGIDTTLVTPAASKAYVWWDGALRSLPAGLVLGVPTDLDAVVASGIVDGPLTVHPAGAPLAPGEDVSVGALVRPQLGDAVFERLVDPLLGGINAGDSDRLSVRAAAPQLAAAAERDRDLVAGLRALPAPAPGPIFYAPAGGMGALVDALAAWLRANRVELRVGDPAGDVDGIDADGVVVAVPAPVASRLVRRAAPAAATILDDIRYSSVALVTLAFDPADVHRELDGSGFLVPRTTGLLLTAGSWASSKWAHLAPGTAGRGQVIVRLSTGRFGDDRFTGLDDGMLVRVMVEELAMTSAIRGEPTEVRVSRWIDAFPQYEPGHLERVDAIERALAGSTDRVVVAGAALRGIGVPACIRQGRDAAAALVARARS